MLRLFFFAIAFFACSCASSSEDVSCAQSRSSYLQCSFDVPHLKNGQSTVVDTDTPLFKGALAASCKNGLLITGQSVCTPSDPSTCSIPDAQWAGQDGNLCSHEMVPHVIDSGQKLSIKSEDGNGSITYACQNGKLSAVNLLCEKKHQTEKLVSSDKSNAVTSSQSVTTSSDGLMCDQGIVSSVGHGRYNESNGEYTLPPREKELAEVCKSHGFSSLDEIISLKKEQGTADYFEATLKCGGKKSMCEELRCDQGVISSHVNGRYNTENGEFTLPPGEAEILRVCQVSGFESVDEVLYLDRVDGVVDLFSVTVKCGGKNSMCGAKPDLGSPEIVSATSCTTAIVRSGLIEVRQGEAVSQSAVLEQACRPLGFDSVFSFGDPTDSNLGSSSPNESSGAFSYRTITAECTNYTKGDSHPLLPECKKPTGSNGGKVVPKTCDTGIVTGLLPAEKNQYTMQYTERPSATMVLSELCNANSYNELVSMSTEPTGDPMSYLVTATCKGYYGPDRSSCEIMGLCFGRELAADSQEPSLIYNGKRYLNACATKSPPPAELCKDCSAGSFSFTDPATGNVCDIATPHMISGGTATVSFSNNIVNGTVDVSCNNASKSLLKGGASTCYKSCKGDTFVEWNDKSGASSCSQRVPSGVYSHGQEISLGSSISHTGSASIQCDGYTGRWNVKNGTCALDCSAGSGVNWGDGGTPGGACSGTLPAAVKHGYSGSLANANPSSSGSASYQCEDGRLSVTSGSCSVSCAAGNQSWGGQCQSYVPSLMSGSQHPVSHSGNQGNPYDNLTSGSAVFACTNGVVSQISGSCNYPTGVRESAWGSWRETKRDCSGWSPDPSTVQSGEPYTKTRSCTVDLQRSRDVFYTWNVGSDTHLRTETDSKTVIETEYSTDVGTKSNCRYDANNYILEEEKSGGKFNNYGPSTFDFKWVWDGKVVYTYHYSASQEPPYYVTKKETGSREGYYSGNMVNIKKHDNVYGYFYWITDYQICR